jgi:hypothetical protein
MATVTAAVLCQYCDKPRVARGSVVYGQPINLCVQHAVERAKDFALIEQLALDDIVECPKLASGLTHKEIAVACLNMGVDLTCGACASQFYTGTAPGLTHTCKRMVDAVILSSSTPKKKPTKPRRPPMQPIYVDDDGVARFRANAVVRWIVDSGRVNLNDLGKNMGPMNRYDVAQFYQLLGYSVSGYGDLDFIPRSIVEKADAKADALEAL